MIKVNRFFYCVLLISLFFACSKDESTVENPLNDENFILNFELPINGQSIQGSINDTSNTIVFNTQNANLDNLTPFITISTKSNITPSGTAPQNFSSPVSYIVTAENGDERTYEVTINNTTLNGNNELIYFSLNINGEDIIGEIDEDNKTVTFNVAGAILEGLTPTLEISESATVSPSPETPQDFNNIIAYTIIASDGTPSVYRIIVNNRPLSDENSITFFSVSDGNTTSEASIDEESGIISFNFGELDRSNLTTEITIPEYAEIAPEIGIAQDFTEPIIYEVTAENGDKKVYKVIANLPRVNNIGGFNFPAKLFVGAEMSVSGRFLDMSIPGASLALYNGNATYDLEIDENNNSYSGLIQNSYIVLTVPDNIPTYENYQLLYRANGLEILSELTVDIKHEDAPSPLMVDKNQYRYNDELVITGENLSEYIAIPAPNASIYLMNPYGSQIQVNDNKTELRVILDIRQLFPSYFGDAERETTIIILDAERRRGRTIQANFY